MTRNAPDLLREAFAHHQSGRFDEAEKLYYSVLDLEPDNPDAQHNLGVLALQRNQLPAALGLFEAAVKSSPGNVYYWLSLVDGQIRMEQWDQAEVLLNQAASQGLQHPAMARLRDRIQIARSMAGGQDPEASLLELAHAGDWKALEAAAREVLHVSSVSGPGQALLGLALLQQGRNDEAATVLARASELLSGEPNVWVNLGLAQQRMGQIDLAVASFRRALTITSDLPEAHFNLGNLLFVQQQFEAATSNYRNAIALRPDFVQAHKHLGDTLMALGQTDLAATSYRRALELNPSDSATHVNLGIVLTRLGDLDAAVDAYNSALVLKPNFAEAHNNLGNVLLQIGQIDSAVSHLQQALTLKPDLAHAHVNMGNAYEDRGLFDAALSSYRCAVALAPGLAIAHINMGNALAETGQFTAAEASFRRALKISPDNAEAHNNLGKLLTDMGRFDGAISSLRRALELNPDFSGAFSNVLLNLCYCSDVSATDLFNESLRFAEQFERPLLEHRFSHDKTLDQNRRVRVGFVSGDFRQHPVGFFMENVLAHMDRRAIEIFLYSTYHGTDPLTKRLQDLPFSWRSLVGLSDRSAAQRIRNDRIDILVDLSGHTAHNRLLVFAHKPAPVQVTWLGYFATTGLQAMDYILCDRWVVPPSEAHYFVETPWYIPDRYLCFTPPRENVQVGVPPALDNKFITFGCFNNLAKVNNTVVALWARLLSRVPDSRLFIKAKQMNDRILQEQIRRHFAAHGIESDRLILEGNSPRAQYLAAYNRVDIALDPFPYTGGTTSVESLWMGVPVLTRRGDRFVSHMGESILHNAGLPGWIAADDEAYVAMATSYASDLRMLAEMRSMLRHRVATSPLCDAEAFSDNLAEAFLGMWCAYCSRACNV